MSSIATSALDPDCFQELVDPYRAELHGYASAQAFTKGFGPAICVSSGLALLGALCGLALPARRHREVISTIPSLPEPAIEVERAA